VLSCFASRQGRAERVATSSGRIQVEKRLFHQQAWHCLFPEVTNVEILSQTIDKMDKPSSLELLGEKNLPQAADPGLVTYCPSMDLIALGTTDQQVLVYRLNGQRVYGAAQKIGKLTIESIKWKPNGMLTH
jgi:hypothetical protein